MAWLAKGNPVIGMKKTESPGKSRTKTQRGATATARVGFQAPLTNDYFACFLLLAVVAVCYANSLRNGFVFDDAMVVLGNPLLRNITNLPRLLFDSYRPVRDMSHAVDFALWGENPLGFHLMNVFIHAANVLLVFWLMRRFGQDLVTGIVAALIFAIQPLQTDAVTYISGRRDLLFALFYLASFHSYLSYRNHRGARRWRSVGSFGLFLLLWGLSLGSKEMAASLPLFVLAWNFCGCWSKDPGPRWKKSLKAFVGALATDRWLYLILAVLAGAYGYYMSFVKGGSTLAGARGLVYWGGSFYTNLLTVLSVHGWYLKQLVFPTPVVQYLGAFPIATTFLNWRVLVSVAAVGSVLAAGLSQLPRDRLLTFAVLSYFVLLLPVSQIIPHHELLADHYLYLPMMSFGLLVARIIHRLAIAGPSAQKIAYGVVCAGLIVFAVMTVLRNRDWKDDFTLWQAAYKEAPNSVRAAANFAALNSTRNPGKAIELYRRSIELDPTYAPAYLGLASLLQTRDEAQKLERLILDALAMPQPRVTTPAQQYYRSSRSDLTTALALTKYNQGNRDEAEKLLREVMGKYPQSEQPYKILAQMYHEDEPERELEVLKRQADANPSNLRVLDNLSRSLILLDRYEEALPYLERIIALDPANFSANCHVGQIYQKRNDCRAARSYFATARSSAVRSDQLKSINELDAGLERQCGRQ